MALLHGRAGRLTVPFGGSPAPGSGKDDFLGQLRLTGKGLDFLPEEPRAFPLQVWHKDSSARVLSLCHSTPAFPLQPFDKLEWSEGKANGRLGRGYFAIVPPRSLLFI